MTKLAVIVNPLARGVRRDPELPARLRALGVDVYVSSEDTLDDIARELANAHVDLVALCGGDGTGQATLTSLERAYTKLPRIALLGGGTINTVARNFGIRGTPEALLRRLLDARSATVRQTLIRVNGRLGFLFAALLGARFLERYYAVAQPTPARAAQLALGVAMNALLSRDDDLFAPAHVNLDVDGHAHELDARLLVCSTIPDVGVGMRITPRARDAPARFQLVAAGVSALEMARQIPAVQAGRALQGSPIVDALCSRASITFEHLEPYTLDGDLFSASTITIEAAGPIDLVLS